MGDANLKMGIGMQRRIPASAFCFVGNQLDVTQGDDVTMCDTICFLLCWESIECDTMPTLIWIVHVDWYLHRVSRLYLIK